MRNVVINVIMRDRVSRQMGALARSTANARNQFNSLAKSSTVLGTRLNAVDRRVKEVHRSLLALSKVKPNVNINVHEGEALASIRRVSAAARELSGKVIHLRTSVDTSGVRAQLSALTNVRRVINIRVALDASSLARVRGQLAALTNQRHSARVFVGVDGSSLARARAQIAAFVNQRRSVHIRVNVDSSALARAAAGMRGLSAQSVTTSRVVSSNFMRARQSLVGFANGFNVLNGRGMAFIRLGLILGPVVAGAFAVAARGILQAVTALGTATLGAGVFMLAMRNVIKTNSAAQAQVSRLKAAFNSFGLGSSRIITQVLTVSVSALINVLKALEPAVRPLSGVFLAIAREIEAATRSPGMTRFSNWFRVAAPAAVTSLWGTIKVFAKALFTTLSKIGAFNGTAFLNWLNRCAHAFNTWANSGGPERLKAFMDQWGPAISRAAAGLFQLAFAIGGALNPILVVLVGWLGTFSQWLARLINQHPILGQVLAGVIIGYKLLGVVVPLVSTAYRILTGNIFRNTMAWLLNKAAILSHRATSIGSHIASAIGWLAAQSAALVRNTGAWIANRVQVIAHRAASAVSTIMGAIGALAAQSAALVRNAAMWVANRVAMMASVVWFGIVRTATLAYTAAMWLLNIAMRANPFILIITLLIALGFALVTAYKRSETFRNIVNGAFNGVRAAAMFLWNGIQISFGFIWNLLRTIYNWIRSNIRLIGPILLVAFLGPLGLIIAGVVFFRGTIIAIFNAIRNGIVTAWRATWNLVRVIFNGAWNAIRASFNVIRSGLVAGFNFLRNGILVAWRATWNFVRSIFNSAWNAIRASFNVIRNSLVAGFNFLRNGILIAWRATWNIVRSVFNTAWNAIRSSLNVIRGALVAAFNFIRNGILTVWRGLWNIVRSVFNGAWNAIRSSLNAIRGALVAAFNFIRNGVLAVWRGMWNLVRNVFNTAWNAIRSSFGAIRGAFISAFNALRNGALAVWRALWNGVRAVFNAAWSAIRTTVSTVRGFIVSAFNAVRNGVISIWNAMWSRVRGIFNGAWGAIRGTFNVLRSFVGGLFRAVSSFATNAWGAMWARIRQVFNNAWGAIRGTFNTVRGWISGAFRAISRFATNTWGTMWNRIRQVFNIAWNAVRGTFTTVRNWIGSAFRAISRFVTNTWGTMWNRIREVFSGAWGAIRRTFTTLRGWIIAAFRFISSLATRTWGAMWNRIRDLLNMAWAAIRRTFSTLRGWISSAFRAISSFVTNTWGNMWNRIRDLLNDAWGRIRGTFSTMSRTLKGIWNGIVNAAKSTWDAIKGAIARPINFVIGFVADRLIPFANKALSLVLGKKAPQINGASLQAFKIPGFAEGGVVDGYAAGGVLKGYSPGKDNMIGHLKGKGPIGLSGGEGILRPEVMRAPGMKQWLHSANAQARKGGVTGVKRMSSDNGYRHGHTRKNVQQYREGERHVNNDRVLAKIGFKNGGIVGGDASGFGGIPTVANFDIGGAIKGAIGKLTDFSPVGMVSWAKKQIEEKGFNILIDKVLGKIYNNAMSWFGQFGWIGQMGAGIMEKVVGTIVNWVVDKTTGGGGGASSVVDAAKKYIGKGDRGGGDNNMNQFNDQWGMPGAPWCANFVSTCIKDAKAEKFYPGYPTAAVHGYWSKMKHVPWNSAQPGDLRTTGSSTHINIVEKKQGSGLGTIGGNQGPKVNRRVDHSGTILRPKGGAPSGGGGSGSSGGGKGLASFSGTGAGGIGGGGRAFFTHFWDGHALTASGSKMTADTIASSYIPLGSHLSVEIKGKSTKGVIRDLGPAKFVYDRHPGVAVLDLATPMMKKLTGGTGNHFGKFRIDKVGSGRTLYGKRLRGYADGGMMAPGELAVVGERGPELFRAGSGGGRVHPDPSSIGGGVTFNNCTFVGGNQRQMEDAVVHAISEAERKGRLRRNRG